MREIVLASQSPRRHEILKSRGVVFVIDVSGIDENIEKDLTPRKTAEELSKRKAQVVAKRHPNSIVIGADTVVSLNSNSLDKPSTAQEALSTLESLSGQTHQVFTGFTIIDSEHMETSSEKTDVTFKQLSNVEIQQYVDTGDPMDKAGAYGIQSGAGKFVDHYEGDYLNIVGLPTSIFAELEKFGVKVNSKK